MSDELTAEAETEGYPEEWTLGEDISLEFQERFVGPLAAEEGDVTAKFQEHFADEIALLTHVALGLMKRHDGLFDFILLRKLMRSLGQIAADMADADANSDPEDEMAELLASAYAGVAKRRIREGEESASAKAWILAEMMAKADDEEYPDHLKDDMRRRFEEELEEVGTRGET